MTLSGLSKFPKSFSKARLQTSARVIGFFLSLFAMSSSARLAFGADETSQKAIDFFKAGRYEEACPLFERLVDRNANDVRAQYYLALVCHKLGQNDRAIFLFEKIASTSPTSAEAKLSKQAIAAMPQGKGSFATEGSNSASTSASISSPANSSASSSASSFSSSSASSPSSARAFAASPAVASAARQAESSVSSGGSSVPRVDEIDYWRRVKSIFPQNELAAILLLKPKYRANIFSGQSTLNSITNGEYTGAQRETDNRWIQQFQSQESSYRPVKNITIAGYPIDSFVGYKVGSSGRFYDGDGICYKVFFEFRDASADLTPELYMQFSTGLSDAGFVGDSKISMVPGYARFNYNNVIVHTGSPEMGKLAEQVGLKLFGSKLAHYARGLDVMQNQQDGHFSNPLDWHHFLGSVNDLSRLSSRASAYVNFSD